VVWVILSWISISSIVWDQQTVLNDNKYCYIIIFYSLRRPSSTSWPGYGPSSPLPTPSSTTARTHAPATARGSLMETHVTAGSTNAISSCLSCRQDYVTVFCLLSPLILFLRHLLGLLLLGLHWPSATLGYESQYAPRRNICTIHN
jgi:hypothetical protein